MRPEFALEEIPSSRFDQDQRHRRRLSQSTICSIALGFLAVLLFVDQARALFGFSRNQTDQDQTLLWLAGRDIFHFHLHEPNFFGQNYNTTFEAIPGQLFHDLGMSYATASPLGSTIILTACWVVLAIAAYWRRNFAAAAAALAFPICLPIQYLLLADAPRGILAGDSLAALCIATAVSVKNPQVKLALVLLLGGLALLWDNATILAVAPAIAGVLGGCSRELITSISKSILMAALGLIVPLVWWATDHWWYSTHPIDFTAFPVQSGVSLSTLEHNLEHLGPLLGFYEAQLSQHLAVSVLLGAVFISFAVYSGRRRRSLAPIFALLGLLLAVLVILSVRDSLNQSAGLYLSGNRFLLPLPLGVWTVIAFASERRLADSNLSVRAERSRLRSHTLAVSVICLIAVASFLSEQVLFAKTTHEVATADATPAAVVETMNPSALINQCSLLTSLYERTQSQVLVTNSPDIAYGCDAANGINTVDQTYDRRGWVLSSVGTNAMTRILLQGWTCSAEIRAAGRCVDEPGGNALLITTPLPAAVSLDRAGLPIRGTSTSGH